MSEETVLAQGHEMNIGNDGQSATGAESLSTVATDLGMPEDMAKEFMNNDPSFAEFVNSQPENEDRGGNGDHAAEEKAAEDSPADGGEDEPQDADADGKDSSAETDGEKFEFADNVIDGMTGEDFGKLPDSAQEALASFYAQSQAKVQEAEEYKSKVDALLNDPVIKSRAEMINAGRGDIAVRGLTPVEKKSLVDSISKIVGLELEEESLGSDEAKNLLSAIENGLETVAKQIAQDYTDQAILTADAVRQQAEISRQGNEALLGLRQFNKELEVKEKDISKFYVFGAGGAVSYNEKHPEIEKFKNGIGKISAWADEHGIDYAKMLKMGSKAFYAAAAAALDMPVALNTTARDQKIAADARKKALAPFLRTKGGTLDVDGRSAVINREKAETVTVNGMDAVRLVEDGNYYDEVVARRPNDADWLAKVEAAATKGRAIIDKRKNQ
jgi:hypothetical protein